MTASPKSFHKNERLIDEPISFATQAAEDTRLGNQHGVDGHSQLGGHGPGRHPVDNLPSERAPGGRLELGLDQLQQSIQHVSVVLLIPAPAQVARRVFQLIEQRAEIRRAERLGAKPARPQGLAEAIDGDRAQPGPERSGSPVMLEPRDLADDDSKNILCEILGIACRDAMVAQPGLDRGE
jgi:hypothetical protein